MLFVFLWFFCMFIIVPVFLYPTEIFPQEVRAQGYAFTIFGWYVILSHIEWSYQNTDNGPKGYGLWPYDLAHPHHVGESRIRNLSAVCLSKYW